MNKTHTMVASGILLAATILLTSCGASSFSQSSDLSDALAETVDCSTSESFVGDPAQFGVAYTATGCGDIGFLVAEGTDDMDALVASIGSTAEDAGYLQGSNWLVVYAGSVAPYAPDWASTLESIRDEVGGEVHEGHTDF